MIPSDIVRDLTGLTSSQLYQLRKHHLIPRPTRADTMGHGGSTYVYPKSVLNRIRLIKLLRAKGVPLIEIARAARGTPFEWVEPTPSGEGKVRRA